MSRMRLRYQKTETKILVLGFLGILSLFFILKLFYRFPFITDDYWFLAKVAKGEFHLTTFGAYWARVPLWCLSTWAAFASGLVYSQNVAYTGIFAGNALCLMLIARELSRQIQPEARLSWIFVLLCGIYAFFPNDHEVLYWPTDWAYLGGLPLLYAGWKQRRPWAKSLLYTTAFCFGEMHILPALALELVPFLFPLSGQADLWTLLRAQDASPATRARRKQLLLTVIPWIGSALLFLLVRRGLALVFGAYSNKIAFNPGLFPGQLEHMLKHFFIMSFYKDFWPPTLLYWIGALVSLSQGRKHGLVTKNNLLSLAMYILICGSLVFVMGYFAPRALYGASVCVNALLIVFLERSLRLSSMRWKTVSLLALALGFFGQTLLMFDLKQSNFWIMREKEQALVLQMQTCQEPCQISVQSMSQGLKRGWVMHADYAKPFAEWVKLRNLITKKVDFNLGSPP